MCFLAKQTKKKKTINIHILQISISFRQRVLGNGVMTREQAYIPSDLYTMSKVLAELTSAECEIRIFFELPYAT